MATNGRGSRAPRALAAGGIETERPRPEVQADLPLSDDAARGLCHLLLVAGLAQQGAGVVAKGGRKLAGPPDTSARIHLLHADAGRPASGRPVQLDLAPKLLP